MLFLFLLLYCYYYLYIYYICISYKCLLQTFPPTLSTSSSWCGMMMRRRRTVQIIPWQWDNSRLWRPFNWPEHVHGAKKVTSVVGKYMPNSFRWQKRRLAFTSFDATPLSHLFLSHAHWGKPCGRRDVTLPGGTSGRGNTRILFPHWVSCCVL